MIEEITWGHIIEECKKNPDDPGAQVFLEIQADMELLKELCYRAYTDSNIHRQKGWVADYKRLVEEGL